MSPLLLLAFPQSGDLIDPLYSELRAHWDGLAVQYLGLRPGAPEPELEAMLIEEATRRRGLGPLLIGGFSLGARIAAQVAEVIAPDGFVGYGYPFHPRSDPHRLHGLASLRALTVPTVIVQGARDAHGNRDQVRGYGPLGENISVLWLDDATHRFEPRRASSWSREEHVQTAADTTRTFVTAQGHRHV